MHHNVSAADDSTAHIIASYALAYKGDLHQAVDQEQSLVAAYAMSVLQMAKYCRPFQYWSLRSSIR
eukprot:704051-Rhodomonas_salina.2